jgi:hypothetical protein
MSGSFNALNPELKVYQIVEKESSSNDSSESSWLSLVWDDVHPDLSNQDPRNNQEDSDDTSFSLWYSLDSECDLTYSPSETPSSSFTNPGSNPVFLDFVDMAPPRGASTSKTKDKQVALPENPNTTHVQGNV